MTTVEDRMPAVDRETRSPTESLGRALQDLGMSPYQARVLAALVQVERGNSLELAELSGVPRTSTYAVMEALTAQGLAERLPSNGPAVWTCPGREVVVQVLDAAGEAQMRRYQAHLDCVRQMLEVSPLASRPPSTGG